MPNQKNRAKIELQVTATPDPDKTQTQERLFTPFFHLIREIIDEMIENGEIVIVDGQMAIPGQIYTMPVIELEVNVE